MFLVARLRRLAPTTWLTAAVLVLLPLLAVLQHRWLSQVGADAGSRIQAVAANAARALSRDLAFEVNRAWLERAGGQASPAADATGSGAPLVVDALVISLDPAAQGEPALRRWNLEARTCEPFAWPAGYDAIRAAVRDRDADQSDGRVARGLLDSLRRDGAALGAIPVAVEDEGPSRGSTWPPCVGLTHVIVLFRLDTAALRQTLLPELVRRHLEGLQGDFRFAIVAGPAQRDVLYSSPASDAAAIAARPDVVVPITFGGNDRDRGQRGGGLPRRGGGPPRGASGPPDMGRDPQGHGGRGAAWLIVGQHRSGSLEAAVASLRLRNLAVSFGILLLMGVAVTIIAANARRAERLAGQQVDFVAAVSHEMRTPVSAIDLAAKNLEDGLIADPARVQRYGGVIRAEARRLGETVERVLQFAALDAGRADGTPVDIDLRSLVEDVVSQASAKSPARRWRSRSKAGWTSCARIPPCCGRACRTSSAMRSSTAARQGGSAFAWRATTGRSRRCA